MKYVLAIMIALMLFTSCKEKTKEDYVKEAFEEYVKTDFDDPNDFLEVTKIEAVDTLNKEDVSKVLETLTNIRTALSEKESAELDTYIEKFKKDSTNIVTYLVKIRVKRSQSKRIEEYYVIDNNDEMKVQDHLMDMYEVPEPYRGFFSYARQVLRDRLF